MLNFTEVTFSFISVSDHEPFNLLNGPSTKSKYINLLSKKLYFWFSIQLYLSINFIFKIPS